MNNSCPEHKIISCRIDYYQCPICYYNKAHEEVDLSFYGPENYNPSPPSPTRYIQFLWCEEDYLTDHHNLWQLEPFYRLFSEEQNYSL